MGMRFSKLRGRIREKFGTQSAFAKALGVHTATLSQKLRGVSDWTRPEIDKAVRLLDIPAEEIAAYFEMGPYFFTV